MEAAKALVEITPQAVLNAKTTGSQPSTYTCLHFACGGSDKTYGRQHLVKQLLEKRAYGRGLAPIRSRFGSSRLGCLKRQASLDAGADGERWWHWC